VVGKIQVPVGGKNAYSSFAGFSHLAAGLACGLSSLAAGLAIGVVGDAGVRAVGQQPSLFVGTILVSDRVLNAGDSMRGALRAGVCSWGDRTRPHVFPHSLQPPPRSFPAHPGTLFFL
jgi:F0F1-type ATP synthase membrane subunit c/vacuolar-type H+-ATPase subunit K